jgi:hypothetical protein
MVWDGDLPPFIVPLVKLVPAWFPLLDDVRTFCMGAQAGSNGQGLRDYGRALVVGRTVLRDTGLLVRNPLNHQRLYPLGRGENHACTNLESRTMTGGRSTLYDGMK